MLNFIYSLHFISSKKLKNTKYCSYGFHYNQNTIILWFVKTRYLYFTSKLCTMMFFLAFLGGRGANTAKLMAVAFLLIIKTNYNTAFQFL